MTVPDGAFVEKESVEGAVDNVAQGARKNERNAEYKKPRGLASDQFYEVKSDDHAGQQAKSAEQDFAPIAPKFEAEGHAGVFDVMQIEPIPEHLDAVAKGQRRFDPEFENLVGNKDAEEGDEGRAQRGCVREG